MKKIKYILLVSVLLLFSCESKESHEGHDHEGHNHGESGHGEESEHHEENEVTISETQAQVIKLSIGSFKQMKVSETIETNGELELAPQNIADVHVLIGGLITKINVTKGSKVKKGQVLATLKHPEIIHIQEELIKQSSQMEYLEKQFLREEKLYSENVGSGKDFQKVKAEYEGGKALLGALKAKVQMLGLSPSSVIGGKIATQINIYSPLNGQVSLVETNIGQFVSSDKRLFQIVDNKRLYCTFSIYENDILKVKKGQTILVNSPSFENMTFNAIISSISPAFEENPKNVKVRADLSEHDERLISGMYVSGKIKTDSISRTVLPRDAVVIEDGKKYIFIHHEENENKVPKHDDHENHNGEHSHLEENEHHDEIHFKKMQVTTGIEQDDWVEILNSKEFSKNVEVALTSAYYLQAEIGKGETEHVH